MFSLLTVDSIGSDLTDGILGAGVMEEDFMILSGAHLFMAEDFMAVMLDFTNHIGIMVIEIFLAGMVIIITEDV